MQFVQNDYDQPGHDPPQSIGTLWAPPEEAGSPTKPELEQDQDNSPTFGSCTLKTKTPVKPAAAVLDDSALQQRFSLPQLISRLRDNIFELRFRLFSTLGEGKR